jgi:hypothetical protein
MMKKEEDWIKYKYVTNRVLAYANLKGMKLKDVAECLGYKRSTFYKKLKVGLDKWTKAEIEKLTNFLNCRLEDLTYKEVYTDIATDNERFDKEINEVATVTCSQCGLIGLPKTCVHIDFEWFHYPGCYQKYVEQK